jgi:hypothetical protein
MNAQDKAPATAAAAGAKDAKADASVEALTKAVAGASIAGAADAKAEQENLWTKIIDERKFAPLTEDDLKKLWSSFDTNNG